MSGQNQGSDRRTRMRAARLYLVCGATSPGGERGVEGEGFPAGGLADLLRGAIGGGVDVVQLREKGLPDDELVAVANAARALCERLGALLIVNDRPWAAVEAGADGVHVGQEDMPVSEVRELVGPDMLIGLSTHSPEQIDATDPSLVDYIGVGPIHETPTKPGRAAVGLELIRYASAHSPVPFFAIGGWTRATSERRSTPGRAVRACCGRSRRPRTRRAPPANCGPCCSRRGEG